MTKADVNPGICGFATTVTCEVDDAYQATIVIESQCAHVAKLSQELGEVSVLGELRVPINETAVYRAAAICRLHAACPVPSAILKAIEVSAGLALPADVHVSIET
jgi:hypothetical protein